MEGVPLALGAMILRRRRNRMVPASRRTPSFIGTARLTNHEAVVKATAMGSNAVMRYVQRQH